MNHKLKRVLVPIISFVALVALACTCGGSGVTPTDVPLPTDAPPTKPPVTLPTDAPATKPPIGGGGNTGGGFEISPDIYTHSSGAFSTALPAGWTLEERSDGIYLSEDGGASAMDMSFTQVGVEFTADELTNYINNIEFNWFGSFADYTEQAREPQDDGSLLVLKSLTTSNGTSYDVFSYYWQVGTVVYEQDFWATTDEYDVYVDGFVEIANSAETNPDAASSSPLYEFRFTYNCPGDICSFSVPYGWSWTQNTDYDNTIIDTFQSPDEYSFVDNFVYDDGTPINQAKGQFALILLREFYQVDDIVVTDDQVQGDGSERLIWYSKSGGYSGTSFFETRGETTFLMLTWVVNDAYYDLYLPIWSDLLDTYTIP